MSYLDTFSYSSFFDEMLMTSKYTSKFMSLPDDVPIESFVIDVDDDEEFDSDLDEVKVEDVGCEEVRVDMLNMIDAEIKDFVERVTREAAFDFYCEWYNFNCFGTLEHPEPLYDDNGEILTARSYYNCKNNKMVEMKLVFYNEQLDQTKQFLQQIGFTFERLDMSLFSIKESDEQGSVSNPLPYLDNSGEMLCCYNNYTKEDSKTMCEMRLVFDGEQYLSIAQSLQAGGFKF